MQLKGVYNKECLSAWGQQSFGMYMPSGLLHWPCDSLVHSVSLHARFFQPMRFFQPFCSFFFGVFFSVSSSFPFWSTPRSFFASVFSKVCLYTCLAITQRHLGFIGSTRSHFVYKWWICPLDYIGFHINVLLYFGIIVFPKLQDSWERGWSCSKTIWGPGRYRVVDPI